MYNDYGTQKSGENLRKNCRVFEEGMLTKLRGSALSIWMLPVCSKVVCSFVVLVSVSNEAKIV